MVMLFITAIVYNMWMFMVMAIFVNMTFSIVEVSIERRFEDYSDKKIRGTAISMAISLSNLLKIVNIMIIGYLAKNYSYHVGLMVITFPLVFMTAFFYKVLREV